MRKERAKEGRLQFPQRTAASLHLAAIHSPAIVVQCQCQGQSLFGLLSSRLRLFLACPQACALRYVDCRTRKGWRVTIVDI